MKKATMWKDSAEWGQADSLEGSMPEQTRDNSKVRSCWGQENERGKEKQRVQEPQLYRVKNAAT